MNIYILCSSNYSSIYFPRLWALKCSLERILKAHNFKLNDHPLKRVIWGWLPQFTWWSWVEYKSNMRKNKSSVRGRFTSVPFLWLALTHHTYLYALLLWNSWFYSVNQDTTVSETHFPVRVSAASYGTLQILFEGICSEGKGTSSLDGFKWTECQFRSD